MGLTINHQVALVFDRDATDVFNVLQNNELPQRFEMDMSRAYGKRGFNGCRKPDNLQLSENNRVITFDSDGYGVWDLKVVGFPHVTHFISRYDGLQCERYDYVEVRTIDQLDGFDFFPYENHPNQVTVEWPNEEEFDSVEAYDEAVDEEMSNINVQLNAQFHAAIEAALQAQLITA